jgi:hypothetical protein
LAERWYKTARHYDGVVERAGIGLIAVEAGFVWMIGEVVIVCG